MIHPIFGSVEGSPGGGERRRHMRFAIAGARVEMRPRSVLGLLGVRSTRGCTLGDLSRGGAEVVTPARFASGDRVRLTISFTNPEDVLSARGVVVRAREDSNDDNWRYGIQFDPLSYPAQAKLHGMERWFSSFSYLSKVFGSPPSSNS